MQLRFPVAVFAAAVCSLAVACDQQTAGPSLPTANIQWERVREPSYEFSATSVWASSLSDIYVGQEGSHLDSDVIVSGRPVVAHFDGASWSEVSLPTEETYGRPRIWGSASNNIYVAVQHLHHFDGVSWTQEPIDARLVTGSSTNKVFASSYDRLFEFNGASWDTLAVVDAPNLFIREIAAAPDGTLLVLRNDAAQFWNGSGWTDAPFPLADYLMAACVFSMTDAFAVGAYGYDRIYRWNGTQWQTQDTERASFTSIQGSRPANVFAIGENGEARYYDGSSWNSLTHGTQMSLYSLTPLGAGFIAAGAGEKVVAYDGGNWSTLRETEAFGGVVALFAESRSRYMLSTGRTLFKQDGDTWAESLTPADGPIYSLGGNALDDLYGIKNGEQVLHYDGNAWSVTVDTLATRQFDVGGTRSGAVYSVGSGAVYRLDGVFQEIRHGSFELRSIGDNADGGFVAAGSSTNGPLVTRFDGSGWHDWAGPLDNIYGVCAGPEEAIFLAGNRGMYRLDGDKFRLMTPEARFNSGVFAFSGGRATALGWEGTAYFDGAMTAFSDEDYTGVTCQMKDGSLLADRIDGLFIWKP